jgi:hypothetical protein
MNRKTYWSVLAVICVVGLTNCNGGGNSTPPPVEAITVTSGSAQSAVINTQFINPLVATVATGATPNAGVVVTFTAPATGASGTFNSGSATATATTDANGVAMSPVFTANGTAGGPYTVTAAAAGVTTPANFSLTNTTTEVASSKFSFYLTGLDSDTVSGTVGQGPNFYALAGSVTIGANGNVLGGEQDYNDAFGATSPQPSGDTITGGALVENAATGQGTLTLITNNTALGVSGTETLGVQFVNASHALLIQFDGSATSSGSLDLQTLTFPESGAQICTRNCGLPGTTVALSGNYSFAMTGVNSDYFAVGVGGVFTVNGTSLTDGIADVNDSEAGVPSQGNSFTGTVSGPDGFGRGKITGTGLDGIDIVINYYIIGPEAVRLIDVDTQDSASGSAFGQGAAAGGFSNASLGPSVFGVGSNSFGSTVTFSSNLYDAVGSISPNVAAVKPAVKPEGIGSVPPPNFTGLLDNNENGLVVASATSISGDYSISTAGNGTLTITTEDVGDVTFLGIYLVDPAINISDPNNTTGGGGALVLDLDDVFNGVGVMIPQTGTSSGMFTGSYAFGGQLFAAGLSDGWEADFLGQGNAGAGGAFTGGGLLNDPFFVLAAGTDGEYNNVTYSWTAVPDVENVGRYTIGPPNPLAIDFGGNVIDGYAVVIYQASAGQLLWVQEQNDGDSMFGGSLQQQTLPVTVAVKKAAAENNLNLKPKPQ